MYSTNSTSMVLDLGGASLTLAHTQPAALPLPQGYQGVWVFKGVPFWAVIVLLVADLAILVHSCLYVLPLYALITPVGSHCPKVRSGRDKRGVVSGVTSLLQVERRDVAIVVGYRYRGALRDWARQ